MKRKMTIPVLFFCLSVSLIHAQGSSPLSFGISYFGETLSHPGISINGDFALIEIGGYSLFLTSQMGWYIHPRNHSAFFLLGGLKNGLGGASGFFGDITLQAGTILGIPEGPIYSRTESGGIANVSPLFSVRFMAMAGLEAGWRFPPAQGVSFALSIRLDAFGEYPYNGYMYFHPVFETGLAASF